MLLVKATCPNCGAPVGLKDEQVYVICSYCDLSMRADTAIPAGAVASPNASAPARVSGGNVPPEEIQRVKQLVLDGKRADAVKHYAQAAAITIGEAEAAVDALVVTEVWRLFRQIPINAIGCSVGATLSLLSAAGLAWSVVDGFEPVPAVVCAVLLVLFVRWLVPKAISSVVANFGAKGNARVVKRSVLRPTTLKDGCVALVLFEVHPDKGGAPFFDEEALLVRDESLPKLEPGNVVRVRFDEPARKRVFPMKPVQVVEAGVPAA